MNEFILCLLKFDSFSTLFFEENIIKEEVVDYCEHCSMS